MLKNAPASLGELLIAVIDRSALVEAGVEVPIGVPLNVTSLVSLVLFAVPVGSIAVTV